MNDKKLTKALIRLSDAIDELKDASVTLTALHDAELTQEQREMVSVCMGFGYADTKPVDIRPTGNGLFWKFEKFLQHL